MITSTRLEGVLLELSMALDAAIEAGPDAYKTDRAANKLVTALDGALLENDGNPVVVEMHDSLFVHRDLPLMQASLQGRSAITFLRAVGAGGMAFERGFSVGDFVRFAKVVIRAFDNPMDLDSARKALANSGARSIGLLGAHDNVTWSLSVDAAADNLYHDAGFELESAQPVHREIASVVEGAMTRASSGNGIEMDDARTASEHLHEATRGGYSDLFQLGERPEYDTFTVQHSMRVAIFATYVADYLGAPREVLTELGAAALLHDVGKGRIPDQILYKPERLDEEERKIIAQHPELGAEILLDSHNVSSCAIGAAWGHHMRFDGRGYPPRRRWFQTSRATSLIQICDVFEALTARRPYKEPYSPARALQVLYADPGAFDPTMLAAFSRALGLYPPGRFICLSDGRLGRVVRAGHALDRPVVRVVPGNTDVDLCAPENAHLSVSMILDEPDFVEKASELGLGDRDLAAPEEFVIDNSVPLPIFGDEAPPAPFSGDAGDAGGGEACGHGDDCRLC